MQHLSTLALVENVFRCADAAESTAVSVGVIPSQRKLDTLRKAADRVDRDIDRLQARVGPLAATDAVGLSTEFISVWNDRLVPMTASLAQLAELAGVPTYVLPLIDTGTDLGSAERIASRRKIVQMTMERARRDSTSYARYLETLRKTIAERMAELDAECERKRQELEKAYSDETERLEQRKASALERIERLAEEMSLITRQQNQLFENNGDRLEMQKLALFNQLASNHKQRSVQIREMEQQYFLATDALTEASSKHARDLRRLKDYCTLVRSALGLIRDSRSKAERQHYESVITKLRQLQAAYTEADDELAEELLSALSSEK